MWEGRQGEGGNLSSPLIAQPEVQEAPYKSVACYTNPTDQEKGDNQAADIAATTRAPALSERIISLDQFRGYTVFLSVFVTFLGQYSVMPDVFRHNKVYFSLADAIMPQFFMAVGFGYRLTALKARQREGWWQMVVKVLKRVRALMILGFIAYGMNRFNSFKELEDLGWEDLLIPFRAREYYQTITMIGVTQLWLKLVITEPVLIQCMYAIGLGTIHMICSYGFWYKYVMERPVIDGGSLGTLAWCLPVVVGSLLYDWQVWSIARWNAYKDGKEVIDVRIRKWRVLSYPRLESELTWKVIRMIGFPFVVGIALMLIGYLLSCITVSPICFELNNLSTPVDCDYEGFHTWYWQESPFVPPSGTYAYMMMMSQRAGSVSYLVFAARFGIPFYLLFYVVNDLLRVKWAKSHLFTVFGVNSVIVYLFRDLVFSAILGLAPKDSPIWLAFIAEGAVLFLTFICLRYLYNQKIFLRLH